jgi:hypothetical protein
VNDWRDATPAEMRRWPTLAMLKRQFADARLVTDDGVNYRYQVRDK